MHPRTLAITALIALLGCAPRTRQPIEEMPAWRTEDGREELRMELLESLIERGATDEALTLIAKMREDGRDDRVLDLYQGMALAQDGFLGEAERVLQSYRKARPRDARALKSLALIYADTDRPDEAIALLDEATRVAPSDAEAWNNLGFLRLSKQRYAEAVDALQHAVSLDGTVSRYRNNLGFALAARGEYRQAFEAFKSAASEASEAHYNLAVAYELADDPPAALRHYRKAVDYNPEHVASQEAIERLTAIEQEDP